MKRTTTVTVLLTLALASGVAAWPGCDDMHASPPRDEPRSTGGPLTGAGDTNSPAHTGIDEPTKYTILLSTFVGPSHAANATRFKELATTAFAPATELLVVHKDEASDLYWNRVYRSAEEAKPDLMKARNFLLSKTGPPAFPGAITVPMMPAEYGPGEWNLKNATWEYEYTVLVGEYEDSPKHDYVGKRIKDCVEHARQLRKKGFDAYYYHGPSKSLVTVGLFLEAAAVQSVIGYEKDRTGQKIPVLGLKIVDPRIEKIMKTKEPPLYCLAWNGHQQFDKIMDKNGKLVRGPIVGSKLFSVPRSASEARKVLETRLRASEEQRRRDIDSLKEPR